jgi:hypothetical protein
MVVEYAKRIIGKPQDFRVIEWHCRYLSPSSWIIDAMEKLERELPDTARKEQAKAYIARLRSRELLPDVEIQCDRILGRRPGAHASDISTGLTLRDGTRRDRRGTGYTMSASPVSISAASTFMALSRL